MNDLLEKRHDEILKLRKNMKTLEENKEVKYDISLGDLKEKNKEQENFIQTCLHKWNDNNVKIHNVPSAKPIARYIRELQKEIHHLENFIKQKESFVDEL